MTVPGEFTTPAAADFEGPLTFGIESLTSPHDPEQTLVVYTVEPESPTARVLPLLTNWGADGARSRTCS